MNVLLVDPFYGGSHKQWAEGWKSHSRHSIHVVGLPGKNWRWRLIGSAPIIAQRMQEVPLPDVIVYSSMANVTAIRGLLPVEWQAVPSALYMHENQLVYPKSISRGEKPKRDSAVEVIQIYSALAVDRIWFNSYFHKSSFLSAISDFLDRFPDYHWAEQAQAIDQKSGVLYVGIQAPEEKNRQERPKEPSSPIILWNHRWDFDKDPVAFFKLLIRLADRGVPFQLVALGKHQGAHELGFLERAKNRLQSHILHWGFVEDKRLYFQLLDMADVLPVTSRQDFFGISTVEAIARNTFPLLPQRLAFPEHIPEDLQVEHLYTGMRDLEEKLTTYLNAPRLISPELKAHISRYYWPNIVANYDNAVDAVCDL